MIVADVVKLGSESRLRCLAHGTYWRCWNTYSDYSGNFNCADSGSCGHFSGASCGTCDYFNIVDSDCILMLMLTDWVNHFRCNYRDAVLNKHCGYYSRADGADCGYDGINELILIVIIVITQLASKVTLVTIWVVSSVVTVIFILVLIVM